MRESARLRSDALGAPDVLAQRRVGEDAVEVGSGELRRSTQKRRMRERGRGEQGGREGVRE
eukprot:924337-Pleurochrysis_carterae.AAC.1